MTVPTLYELTQDVKKYDEVCIAVAYNSARMSGNNYGLKEATELMKTGYPSDGYTKVETDTIYYTYRMMLRVDEDKGEELSYRHAFDYYDSLMVAKKEPSRLSISSIFGSKKGKNEPEAINAEQFIKDTIDSIDMNQDVFVEAIKLYIKVLESKLSVASLHCLGALWANHFLMSKGELPFVASTYYWKELETKFKAYLNGTLDLDNLIKTCESMQGEFFKVLYRD